MSHRRKSRARGPAWLENRCGERVQSANSALHQPGAEKTNMQYKRISADCHLDMPWMPPDLFTSEASRELRDRMPYVADSPDGPQWVTKSGATFGLKNGVGPPGARLVPGQTRRVDIMAETGLFADGQKDIRRVSDPHLRKKDMERD